jgi:hypothetical protein
MNDVAADYQMAYDQAVHFFGEDSEEAKAAEKAAREFFSRGKPAPVTPVVQTQKEKSWVS